MLLSFTCLQLGSFGFSATSSSTDENFLLKLLSGGFSFSTCVLVSTFKAGRPDTFASCSLSEHWRSSFRWESPLPFLGTNVEADSFTCIRGSWLTSNDAVPPSKIFLSGDFMVASRTLSSWRNTCLLSGVSLTSRHHLIMENESWKMMSGTTRHSRLTLSMLPEFVETWHSLLGKIEEQLLQKICWPSVNRLLTNSRPTEDR